MIQARGLTRSFGGVRALQGVDVDLAPGECLALVGENGAGKSTLARVLAGVLCPDAGEILLDGRPVRFASPADALRAGIALVHQELPGCPQLSVAENLCLGRLPRRGPFVDRAELARRARAMLERVGAEVDAELPLGSLSPGQQQLVHVAAAVAAGARVLLLDEPTSSLGSHDAERLLRLVAELKQRGLALAWVGHRLPEVLAAADRVLVLRDGRGVALLPREGLDADTLVRLMVGRDVIEAPAGRRATPGNLLLEVDDLSSPGLFERVSLRVREREIVGLAGLVGAGRSEVARALVGLDPRATGRVRVCGTQLALGRPAAARAAGLGLLPEDRRRQGLVAGQGSRENWALGARRGVFVDRAAETRAAGVALDVLQLKAASLEAPVETLSGGNQQKVVLARSLVAARRVLVADEPTRGVDVGAKATIHARLCELADAGLGILLISSDMPELLALADRVVVMRGGRLVGDMEARRAEPEALLRLMSG